MNPPLLPLSPATPETPADSPPEHPIRWQADLKQAIRSAGDLLRQLQLPVDLGVDSQFPVFVPPALLQRIRPGDPNDPILLQVLPLSDENQVQPQFSLDPLNEQKVGQQKPLLQKYDGRALLVTTGVCGVHCRYCFRRHFPYDQITRERSDWSDWLTPIAQDPSLKEIILSGGDPLMLNDVSLARLVDGLKQIPHVRWLRVHTRMPTVIPSRVTNQLIETLTGFALTTLVVHINHPNEIDSQVVDAVQQMGQANIRVLNQAVLLKRINDNVDTLEQLSCQLLESGIQPYYLHQLDRVQGAAHFEVPLEQGKRLMTQLRRRLPGHAVPQYVQERPGEPFKTLLSYGNA